MYWVTRTRLCTFRLCAKGRATGVKVFHITTVYKGYQCGAIIIDFSLTALFTKLKQRVINTVTFGVQLIVYLGSGNWVPKCGALIHTGKCRVVAGPDDLIGESTLTLRLSE